MKYYTGIDIGSTASKVVVLDDEKIVNHFVLPTGWSSKETSAEIARRLEADGMPINEEMKVIATGYGRVAVDYAAKTVTEITCHGKGGYELLGRDCSIVDIGGQDTKVITVENGVLTAGFPLGVSNHIIKEATVSVESGSLLLIWERRNGLAR